MIWNHISTSIPIEPTEPDYDVYVVMRNIMINELTQVLVITGHTLDRGY